MGEMDSDLVWFAERGHWVIRRVPFTKDQYYVACGYPPYEIMSIYGIKCVEDYYRKQAASEK